MRGLDEVQAKKPDMVWKKHGAKDTEIVQHFVCILWPRNKFKLHFSLLYYTVISFPVGSCVTSFPLPLSQRKAYKIIL